MYYYTCLNTSDLCDLTLRNEEEENNKASCCRPYFRITIGVAERNRPLSRIMPLIHERKVDYRSFFDQSNLDL